MILDEKKDFFLFSKNTFTCLRIRNIEYKANKKIRCKQYHLPCVRFFCFFHFCIFYANLKFRQRPCKGTKKRFLQGNLFQIKTQELTAVGSSYPGLVHVFNLRWVSDKNFCSWSAYGISCSFREQSVCRKSHQNMKKMQKIVFLYVLASLQEGMSFHWFVHPSAPSVHQLVSLFIRLCLDGWSIRNMGKKW